LELYLLVGSQILESNLLTLDLQYSQGEIIHHLGIHYHKTHNPRIDYLGIDYLRILMKICAREGGLFFGLVPIINVLIIVILVPLSEINYLNVMDE
jgi:hypothetical protein